MKPVFAAVILAALSASALGAEAPAGVEWVKLPAGSFLMGAKQERFVHARPVHRVAVAAFELAKTPVTFAQYAACVSAGACAPAHVSDGTCEVFDGKRWRKGRLPAAFQGPDQPVVCVDWGQAKAFSEWAGGRLPTEAQWEYAARGAGADQRFPWGDEPATCETAVMQNPKAGCGRGATWPVCSKPKGNTRQGLCDMAGNVWEWVQDFYHDSYRGAPEDGSAWEEPPAAARVNRGGAWLNPRWYLRADFRPSFDLPAYRGSALGFRPAR